MPCGYRHSHRICARGTETILAQVVRIFGEARPHHAYLFTNQRGNRLKVLVHDGYGICWPTVACIREGFSYGWATAASR